MTRFQDEAHVSICSSLLGWLLLQAWYRVKYSPKPGVWEVSYVARCFPVFRSACELKVASGTLYDLVAANRCVAGVQMC